MTEAARYEKCCVSIVLKLRCATLRCISKLMILHWVAFVSLFETYEYCHERGTHVCARHQLCCTCFSRSNCKVICSCCMVWSATAARRRQTREPCCCFHKLRKGVLLRLTYSHKLKHTHKHTRTHILLSNNSEGESALCKSRVQKREWERVRERRQVSIRLWWNSGQYEVIVSGCISTSADSETTSHCRQQKHTDATPNTHTRTLSLFVRDRVSSQRFCFFFW